MEPPRQNYSNVEMDQYLGMNASPYNGMEVSHYPGSALKRRQRK
jgi:hypothetical protein